MLLRIVKYSGVNVCFVYRKRRWVLFSYWWCNRRNLFGIFFYFVVSFGLIFKFFYFVWLNNKFKGVLILLEKKNEEIIDVFVCFGIFVFVLMLFFLFFCRGRILEYYSKFIGFFLVLLVVKVWDIF